MDYWRECISLAFDEAGITATEEQISDVAGYAESAHQNIGMAMGHDHIGNPLEQENAQLKRAIRDEREKIICRACNGKGIEIIQGPVHSGISTCYKCNGEGRHKP